MDIDDSTIVLFRDVVELIEHPRDLSIVVLGGALRQILYSASIMMVVINPLSASSISSNWYTSTLLPRRILYSRSLG